MVFNVLITIVCIIHITTLPVDCSTGNCTQVVVMFLKAEYNIMFTQLEIQLLSVVVSYYAMFAVNMN